MSNFTVEKQQEFKTKLRKLDVKFSDQDFFALYNELKPYISDSLIRVFNFLEAILENDKLMVVNGILALIYHENNFMEPAQRHAIKARRHFPDTEIWDKIINNTIWNEFMQGQEANPGN